MKTNASIPCEIKGPALLHIKRGEITSCEVFGHTETVKALNAFVETALSSAPSASSAKDNRS
ncbi:hypothetical protein [Pantoea sp. NGS-ED-1003]|uniref:hypothetical protein n=1 Tax=Pantoea sp. NGS-ED-1003 TaxID=1526743 RepID=UPI0012686FD6|nr:hypothetical protein [Pantoea sp. NGS-ED-1003]